MTHLLPRIVIQFYFEEEIDFLPFIKTFWKVRSVRGNYQEFNSLSDSGLSHISLGNRLSCPINLQTGKQEMLFCFGNRSNTKTEAQNLRSVAVFKTRFNFVAQSFVTLRKPLSLKVRILS